MSEPDSLAAVKFQTDLPFRIANNCLFTVGMTVFVSIALWKFFNWTP